MTIPPLCRYLPLETPMSRPARILLACLILLPLAAGHAGDELQYQGLESLQPLDARVEDVSILSASLRVESSGLAKPSGFDAVYRVPGDSGKLMRVNGALFAVFDQSVYQSYQGRSYVDVPPSTVFHIGPPLEGFAGSKVGSEPAASTELIESRQPRAGFGYVAPVSSRGHVGYADSRPSSEGLPQLISDPEYRARRLAELVNRRINDPRP